MWIWRILLVQISDFMTNHMVNRAINVKVLTIYWYLLWKWWKNRVFTIVSVRSVESISLWFLIESTKGIMGLTFDNWIWLCFKELKSSCFRCSALASNKLQAIPFAASFSLWTVVSNAEGLETFAERLSGTVQPHGLEVQGSNSVIHWRSSVHTYDYTNHLSQLCMYSKHI